MTTPPPDPSTLSYEDARAELIQVVKILELGQMSLDESLSYWERGEALAARCAQLLEGARQRIDAAVGATAADSSDPTAPESPQQPE